MKVALYARVSTQRQEKQGTISSQIAALRRYAQEHHYTVAENYVCKDEGYSGALLARPELDRLRDGAEAGAFDAVLVLSPDRLSRKYAYLILIVEEFERFGTQVIFLEQSPGDDPHSALLVQIQGAVAEYERAKIAERYRRGKLHRARQGEVFWASIPYGYRHIARQDNLPAHLVVNESEAEVVQKIFAWHADEGMTIRQITKRLTREDYPTKKGGKQWGETTVHKILRREAYLGTLYYNRSCEESVPVSELNRRGKRKIQKPKSEWIPVSIPSIIDRESFERSQARHESNQQFSPRNLHEEHWLLRRLVRCEKCGLKCACVADRRRPHMPPSYYYRCEKQDRVVGRPRCRPNHIRSEPLDKLVWQEIRRHLLNPELLLKAQAMVRDTQYLDQSFLGTQIQNAKKRLEKLQAQRRRLVDMFQEGFIFREEFEQRMANLSKRIEEMKSDLVTLEVEYKNASDGKQLLSRIKDFTSTVTKNIDKMSFFQKQKLVRTIVQEVVIHDNVVKIYVKIPLPKLKTDAAQSKRIQSENKVSSELILRSRCDQDMDMRMEVDAITEGLNHSHYSRHKLKVCGGVEEFHKCTDRRETEIIEELSLEAEEKTQHLRDGEDHLTVRDIQEKLLPHPITPLLPAFCMTGGTESACLAGKHEETLFPTVWTPDAGKPAHRIAAVEILLNNILDDRTEIPVLLLKPIIIFSKEPLKIIKEHPIKYSVLRMTLAIDPCHSREDDS